MKPVWWFGNWQKDLSCGGAVVSYPQFIYGQKVSGFFSKKLANCLNPVL